MLKIKVMATTKKVIPVKEIDILSLYMNYVLEHEEFPKSIYKFCKQTNIIEPKFYESFGSFESLQKAIWDKFFTLTMDLAHKNKAFEGYSSREKMLTFFYTFFELLTSNRSYVLFVLTEYQGMDMMKNMRQLKGLRKHIKQFATSLVDDDNDQKHFKLTKNPATIFSEGAWLQFMFLLKFWMNDTSKGFEKTDVAIEKSVNTIFDVFDSTPLDNVIDFGKFLWKEVVNS